jgi:hypothetical protein
MPHFATAKIKIGFDICTHFNNIKLQIEEGSYYQEKPKKWEKNTFLER